MTEPLPTTDRVPVYAAPKDADPAAPTQWTDLGYLSADCVNVEKTTTDELVVSWEGSVLKDKRERHALADFDGVKLVALLHMATKNGFAVTVSAKGPGGWRGLTEGSRAGFEYVPPSEISDGWLEVHDPDRTMVLTGVSTHGEAVDRVKDFLGWAA